MMINITESMIIDVLYSYYEAENSMEHARYTHPAFYNGQIGNKNPPPKPKPLMDKETFTKMISEGGNEWEKARDVLLFYILKLNQKQNDEN